MPSSAPTFVDLLRLWGRHCLRLLGPATLPLLFLAAALWSVAPVLRDFQASVPAPMSGVRTVSLFNVWTVVWNSLQFEERFSGYWDAPVFFPEPRSFAFSEPQPATLVLAPFRPHRCRPALAFNLWLIASLTLNGLFAARLLRYLGVSVLFQAAGGTAMVLQPMVHDQLDSSQLAPLWPSLWTITALLQLRHFSCGAEQPAGRGLLRGLEAGVAFCCTAACALHHALFLGLLLLLTGWLLIPFRNFRRWFPGALVACLISLSLVPPARVIRSALSGPDFVREQSLIAQLSVEPLDLVRTSSNAILTPERFRGHTFFPLNPGWIRLAAAAVACAVCCLRRSGLCSEQRTSLMFLAAMAIAAALLALGTRLSVGPLEVWSLLAESLPGFSQVRSPFRFGYFFQVAVLLLSGYGGALICRAPVLQGHSRLRRIIGAALALSIGCEVFPGKLQLVGVPDPGLRQEWLQQVAENLPAQHGLLILPAASTSSASGFEDTVRWMIRCTASGVPLVNGYSGFFPASHYRLQERLKKPWSLELADDLQRQRVGLVLATESGVATKLRETPNNGLEEIWQSPRTGVVLFRINSR